MSKHLLLDDLSCEIRRGVMFLSCSVSLSMARMARVLWQRLVITLPLAVWGAN